MMDIKYWLCLFLVLLLNISSAFAGPSVLPIKKAEPVKQETQVQKQSGEETSSELALRKMKSDFEMHVMNKKARKKKADNQTFSSQISLAPGKNTIIPISKIHANRFLTPFKRPYIQTTSENVEYVIDGSAIYVASGSDSLCTLFIVEFNDRDGDSMSLTLVPKAIPPREITLSFAVRDGFGSHRSFYKAEEYEKKQSDFVGLIKNLVKETAKGNIPDGYSLSKMNPSDDIGLRCEIEGLILYPGQKMVGANFSSYIFIAENITNEKLLIDEKKCYSDNVLAVSGLHRILMPGDATELYFVVKNAVKEKERKRPSLIKRD